MPSRQYLGIALVTVVIAAVAVAVGVNGQVDEPGEHADVPTDVEATTPSSVNSVPHDEGIDQAFVLLAELDARQVIGGVSGASPTVTGRFEAVAETPDQLCVDAVVAGAEAPTAMAVRIGVAGQEGVAVLELGADVPATPVGDGVGWRDLCVPIDEATRTSLEVSTDAYYVEIYADGGDQAITLARGQLQLGTLFDLELDGA